MNVDSTTAIIVIQPTIQGDGDPRGNFVEVHRAERLAELGSM